eukprot:jgi/Mesvir1/14147/Mv21724-RA.1
MGALRRPVGRSTLLIAFVLVVLFWPHSNSARVSADINVTPDKPILAEDIVEAELADSLTSHQLPRRALLQGNPIQLAPAEDVEAEQADSLTLPTHAQLPRRALLDTPDKPILAEDVEAELADSLTHQLPRRALLQGPGSHVNITDYKLQENYTADYVVQVAYVEEPAMANMTKQTFGVRLKIAGGICRDAMGNFSMDGDYSITGLVSTTEEGRLLKNKLLLTLNYTISPKCTHGDVGYRRLAIDLGEDQPVKPKFLRVSPMDSITSDTLVYIMLDLSGNAVMAFDKSALTITNCVVEKINSSKDYTQHSITLKIDESATATIRLEEGALRDLAGKNCSASEVLSITHVFVGTALTNVTEAVGPVLGLVGAANALATVVSSLGAAGTGGPGLLAGLSHLQVLSMFGDLAMDLPPEFNDCVKKMSWMNLRFWRPWKGTLCSNRTSDEELGDSLATYTSTDANATRSLMQYVEIVWGFVNSTLGSEAINIARPDYDRGFSQEFLTSLAPDCGLDVALAIVLWGVVGIAFVAAMHKAINILVFWFFPKSDTPHLLHFPRLELLAFKFIALPFSQASAFLISSKPRSIVAVIFGIVLLLLGPCALLYVTLRTIFSVIARKSAEFEQEKAPPQPVHSAWMHFLERIWSALFGAPIGGSWRDTVPGSRFVARYGSIFEDFKGLQGSTEQEHRTSDEAGSCLARRSGWSKRMGRHLQTSYKAMELSKSIFLGVVLGIYGPAGSNNKEHKGGAWVQVAAGLSLVAAHLAILAWNKPYISRLSQAAETLSVTCELQLFVILLLLLAGWGDKVRVSRALIIAAGLAIVTSLLSQSFELWRKLYRFGVWLIRNAILLLMKRSGDVQRVVKADDKRWHWWSWWSSRSDKFRRVWVGNLLYANKRTGKVELDDSHPEDDHPSTDMLLSAQRLMPPSLLMSPVVEPLIVYGNILHGLSRTMSEIQSSSDSDQLVVTVATPGMQHGEPGEKETVLAGSSGGGSKNAPQPPSNETIASNRLSENNSNAQTCAAPPKALQPGVSLTDGSAPPSAVTALSRALDDMNQESNCVEESSPLQCGGQLAHGPRHAFAVGHGRDGSCRVPPSESCELEDDQTIADNKATASTQRPADASPGSAASTSRPVKLGIHLQISDTDFQTRMPQLLDAIASQLAIDKSCLRVKNASVASDISLTTTPRSGGITVGTGYTLPPTAVPGSRNSAEAGTSNISKMILPKQGASQTGQDASKMTGTVAARGQTMLTSGAAARRSSLVHGMQKRRTAPMRYRPGFAYPRERAPVTHNNVLLGSPARGPPSSAVGGNPEQQAGQKAGREKQEQRLFEARPDVVVPATTEAMTLTAPQSNGHTVPSGPVRASSTLLEPCAEIDVTAELATSSLSVGDAAGDNGVLPS